jgi:hypothetical protein
MWFFKKINSQSFFQIKFKSKFNLSSQNILSLKKNIEETLWFPISRKRRRTFSNSSSNSDPRHFFFKFTNSQHFLTYKIYGWFQFSFFWDPEATVRIADSRSGDDFLKSLDFWNRKVLLWSVSGYRITTTHWNNNRTYGHRFKAATSELVAQKSEKGKETQRERISAWNTHTLTFSCWVCSFGYLLVACLLLL